VSVVDKPKGPNSGAMWRDFRLLREFEISGLQRMRVQKGKGAFSAEVSNVELPSSLGVK
jgi:hypothetical protein